MVKVNASKLHSIQKSLCDEFVTDVDFMDKIMDDYIRKKHFHHQYSIKNILLANEQLFIRKGITTELLAPYNAWDKINRHVKKGEKALYILVPIIYENDDGTNDVYFKRGPVFDLSQTEGEPFTAEYVDNISGISYEQIVSQIDIPVEYSDKEIQEGYTDGETIFISKHISDTKKICVLFHEMGHYYLHWGEDRDEISRNIRELEAEVVSYMTTSALGIQNKESAQYIRGWAGENAPDIIKGRGSKLIQLSQKILDGLEVLYKP